MYTDVTGCNWRSGYSRCMDSSGSHIQRYLFTMNVIVNRAFAFVQSLLLVGPSIVQLPCPSVLH